MATGAGDGRGLNSPKGITPAESVDVGVHKDAGGGESKSGSGREVHGPNSAKKGK